MDWYQVVESRRSVRSYRSDPVPEEALARILRAAQLAPSWKNSQGWEVIVIQSREQIEKLGALLGGNPRGVDFRTLPVMLALVMNPDASGHKNGMDYYLVDAGICGEHIVLAAQAEGLGTCWIGWLDEAPVKRLLGIPEPWRLVMLTPLGYPAGQSEPRPRKAVETFVHKDRW